jgi:DUF4097 and DUF4098 domain-containing protein YvlB
MTPLRTLLAASVLATTAVAAHARIDREIEKNFTVNGAGTLKVSTQGGGIKVVPGSGNAVKVTARQKIKADTDAEADEVLKKLELTFEQAGNDIIVVSRYERQPSGFRWGSWPPVNVDFVVSVPASFSTELRTSGGGINVGDLDGTTDVRTSGGGITLGKMGGTVKAHTSGGSISLAEADASVELNTSGGNITVGRVAGTADLDTSGGSIKIDSVENALNAHTSGGSIRASIRGPLKEDCVLSTSGGSVRVNVDKAAAFTLDASTSGGSVDADGLTLTLTSTSRRGGKLAGTVNGGGPLLKLRSSGGGIDIVAR